MKLIRVMLFLEHFGRWSQPFLQNTALHLVGTAADKTEKSDKHGLINLMCLLNHHILVYGKIYQPVGL